MVNSDVMLTVLSEIFFENFLFNWPVAPAVANGRWAPLGTTTSESGHIKI